MKRETLDTLIAKGIPFGGGVEFAVYGRAKPKRGLECLWGILQWLRATSERKTSLGDEARTLLKESLESMSPIIGRYVVSAICDHKRGELINIADQLKWISRADFHFDKLRWLLLDESRRGAVNLSALKRKSERENWARADLRTWRRIARRLKIKTVAAGRPKNRADK